MDKNILNRHIFMLIGDGAIQLNDSIEKGKRIQ